MNTPLARPAGVYQHRIPSEFRQCPDTLGTSSRRYRDFVGPDVDVDVEGDEERDVRVALEFFSSTKARTFGGDMSTRLTMIKGKMHFPPDVDPADVDWSPLPSSESERNCRDNVPTHRTGHVDDSLP